MKTAIFHDAAISELNEAVEYYDSQCTGLGREFRLAAESAVEQITAHPNRWPKYKNTAVRHCLVRRFPYVIFYLDEPNRLWILAVAHARRRPGYWKSRLSDT